MFHTAFTPSLFPANPALHMLQIFQESQLRVFLKFFEILVIAIMVDPAKE